MDDDDKRGLSGEGRHEKKIPIKNQKSPPMQHVYSSVRGMGGVSY